MVENISNCFNIKNTILGDIYWQKIEFIFNYHILDIQGNFCRSFFSIDVKYVELIGI